MYLESSLAKNNAYYKKFGFEVKKDIHLGVAAGVGISDNESSTSLSSLSSSASEPESAKHGIQEIDMFEDHGARV